MTPYFTKLLISSVLAACLLTAQNICAQNGYITSLAGKDSASYSGDGGPADTASLNFPSGVAIDTSGNIYIADWLNNRVRKVNALTGIITTVAGNGIAGYTGNGGAATAAELDNPVGVALDDTGNIYIADAWNHVIRKVQVSTGKISTVAGNNTGAGGPYGGYSGDGGLATSAKLNNPMGVAVDDSGNIYIADYYNNRIRKVSVSNHYIQTIAGNGFGADTTGGFAGDSAQADSAELFKPTGVAVDDSGNVYIADAQNNRIRMVTASTRIINTIAGTGYGAPSSGGFSGDSGLATAAELYYPTGIALDAHRNIYFTDKYNNRVRKIDAVTHNIFTIAGDGTFGFSGDGGPADSAQLAQPAGIAVDDSGNVYVADVFNDRIREILNSAPCSPSVTLPSIYDSICTGASGIFTLMVANGGSKPVYQWKLNGANAGTDSITFSYTPVHAGDKISCVVTSNASCAFPKIAMSDTIKMGIYSGQVKPTIGISAGADSVCSNIPVTFSSSVLRGGVNPVYIWKLNGDSISDSSSIILTNLHTGNTIVCVLQSSLTCASPDTAISDTLVMTIDSVITPTISISVYSNLCAGKPVSIHESATNTGNNPIAWWIMNGVISPITDTVTTIDSLPNSDTITALLISSLGCVTSDSAVATTILTANPVPPPPVITQVGDSLISNYSLNIGWYEVGLGYVNVTDSIYLPGSTGYYYAIRFDTGGCESANSDTIYFVVQGIADLNNNNGVKLFPNPGNGLITLTLAGSGYKTIQIMDAVGREVYQQICNESAADQNIPLNLQHLASGVYLLQLSNERGIINKRLVLQRP